MTDSYVTKTYQQMMKLAEAISPKAKVRKRDYDDVWEIYIPTNFHVDHRLSEEEYKDTPAWTAYNAYDSSYGGHELHRWAEGRGYDELPIEAVADYYNLQMTVVRRTSEMLSEFEEETGIHPEFHKTLTKAQITLWNESNKKFKNDASEEFKHLSESLEQKWGNIL